MSEHPGKPIGVVIVHGVGDPEPGETLDTLVEGLCGRNPSLSIEATGRRVLAGNKYESEIVVPQRRLVDRSSGTTILVSEVFWGDVGRVSESWRGSLSAVSSLAMGLHALIFAGGGVPGSGPRPHLPHFTSEKLWLRAAFWTAFVGAYHIKGVLMPLAVALAALGAWSMLASSGSRPPSRWTLLVLPLAGILALFLPPPRARKPPSPSTEGRKDPPERWVVPTLAAGIWCVVGYVVPACGIFVATSQLGAADGWRVGLALTVAFGLCHTRLILHTLRADWLSGRKRRAKRIAFCTASIPWIWLTVLLYQRDGASQVLSDLGSLLMSAYHAALGLAALWVFVIGACCSFCVFAPDPKQRNRGKVIFLGYGFEFSLWVAIATTLAWLSWKLPDNERLAWLGVENAYGPGTWFPLVPVFFVVSLALSLTVWLATKRKATPATIADLVGAWPLPLVTITTALTCLVAATTALNFALLGDPPPWVATIGAIILAGLVSVGRWFQKPLHQGLDLATDVTMYFRGRSWASSDQHRTDELLKTRFGSVVDDIVDAKVGQLVVVAHSQGTVIAVDALRGRSNGTKVDLLTMGSPLRSLYARFFPLGFGELVQEVGPNVKRWVNLFRADDYVGRDLCLKDPYRERQIGGQGHEHYWTDASVLEELEGFIRRPM